MKVKTTRNDTRTLGKYIENTYYVCIPGPPVWVSWLDYPTLLPGISKQDTKTGWAR